MKEKCIDLLLIEDNPDDVVLIREYLSEHMETQCSLRWAESLTDAERLLAEESFDVVVMDLNFPGSHGLETLTQVKRMVRDLPIIVLTGSDNQEMGRLAIKEGAQDYLKKNELSARMLDKSIRFARERQKMFLQLEKKKTRLQDNEILFRQIIEKNADGMLLINENGRITYANPAAEEIIGDSNSQLKGKLFGHRLLPGGFINLSGAPRREQPGKAVEMRVKEIEWHNRIVYLATLRDVTEYKNLESSLLIEKERLSITLNSIADGVIVADSEGFITSINQAAEQILGVTILDVRAQPIHRLLNVTEITPGSKPTELGTRTIMKEGKSIIIEYSLAPIQGKSVGAPGYVYIIRDITVRKKMAEEIIKMQKLEALGIVAGKLAHEYYEVLTLILGNITIAKQQLTKGDKLLHMLEKAEAGTIRVRELTNQLHTFSDSGGTPHTNGAIASLVKDIVAAALRDFPVTCNWTIDKELKRLVFDKDQVYTALWNIIKNAREAIPNGGCIDIAIENSVIDTHSFLPLESGDYIKISISDHGEGIDKKNLGKIFDPFFSTKERAIGMGLTTAFSIIQKHKGTIQVESEPGKGSRFSVYLPVSPADSGRETEPARR